MTNTPIPPPLAGLLADNAVREADDANTVMIEATDPRVDALQAMLEYPDRATIGELAALIQSISRDLSFIPAALRDTITKVEAVAPAVASSEGGLGRHELEALGELLSAQAQLASRRV